MGKRSVLSRAQAAPMRAELCVGGWLSNLL